jgi:hypothetical protein
MTPRTRRLAIGLLVAGNAALVIALIVVLNGWLRGTADVACRAEESAVRCEIVTHARKTTWLKVCYRVGVTCRNGAMVRTVRCTTTKPGKLRTSFSASELRDAKGSGTCDEPVSAVVRWVKITRLDP